MSLYSLGVEFVHEAENHIAVLVFFSWQVVKERDQWNTRLMKPLKRFTSSVQWFTWPAVCQPCKLFIFLIFQQTIFSNFSHQLSQQKCRAIAEISATSRSPSEKGERNQSKNSECSLNRRFQKPHDRFIGHSALRNLRTLNQSHTFIVNCALGVAVGLDLFQLHVHSVIPCLCSLPTEPLPSSIDGI